MRSRPAFTVVELLVTIAIIGILVGMLLPAVGAAREAVRKSSCKNNLRQIGIALHSYHDSHGCLPTGCIEWRIWNGPQTQRQFGWSALLLPFLEQRNLHDQIDFTVPFDDPANAAAAAQHLSVYLCPSAPERESLLGPTDYGGLFGETLLTRKNDDGLFLYERSIALAEITDGTSHTMAVSEDVAGPNAHWINGRNVFVQSGRINDPDAWVGDNEIRSAHRGGAMVAFADTHVRFLSDSTERRVLGGMITRAGSEVISSTDF